MRSHGIALIFAGAFWISGCEVLAGPYEDGQAAANRGDYPAALNLWRPLADQGSAPAQRQLGYLYLEGRGITQNFAEALRLLQLAAEQNDSMAINSIGVLYLAGRGVKQDAAEAAKYFQRAAALNDASGQSNLGTLYEAGLGLAKNESEALRYYKLAADQSLPAAQAKLASMHERGLATPKNEPEAARLYKLAADKGFAEAQAALGQMYREGRGVAKDLAEAVVWMRKAADGRNAGAQNNLGAMYERGEGLAQDYKEAARLFRLAAGQGNQAAQYNLAQLYFEGRGVNQDYREGFLLAAMAAARGFAPAHAIMALAYSEGRGVPPDLIRAHMWSNLAAASLSGELQKKSEERRNIIASRLSPAQITQAQELAQKCKSSNYKDCGLPGGAPQPASSGGAQAQSAPAQSFGTGFYVSADGYAITNAHVVQGCKTIQASRGGELQMIAIDPGSDLALLKAAMSPPTVGALRAGRGIRPGDDVVAVGYPFAGAISADPTVTTGSVASLTGPSNDRRRIQITAPIQPGNSGGPVLSRSGAVVGVAVGKLNAIEIAKITGDIPQNVNFAVSLGTLQSFLDANGVAYKTNGQDITRSAADIAAEATRFTVKIDCLR